MQHCVAYLIGSTDRVPVDTTNGGDTMARMFMAYHCPLITAVHKYDNLKKKKVNGGMKQSLTLVQ